MGRVPGYLGNTSYWFGELGFSSSRSRRRRDERRQQQLQQQQQQLAKQQASNIQKQIKVQQRLAQPAFNKGQQQAQQRIAQQRQQQMAAQAKVVASRAAPPKPTAAPLIMPTVAPAPSGMTLQQEEAMLMAQLNAGASEAPISDPAMDAGGGGGGDYTPSSGGEASMTPEEMEEQRSIEAERVAAELAAKFPGKTITQAEIQAEVETRLPQAPVFPSQRQGPARQGFFGKVLDALFGPPSPPQPLGYYRF